MWEAEGHEKKLLKYQYLKEDIRRKINEGIYGESSCLPPERELCEAYSASRMTVRRAVEELEKEGVLYKLRGKGTFVRKEGKMNQQLSRLTSFSDDMRGLGMEPGSKILLLDVIMANRAVAEKLQVPVGSDVVILRRLRLADGSPIAIETTYLKYAQFSNVFHMLADNSSLYQLMKEKLGVRPQKALQTVEVAPLMEWEASLLGEDSPNVALLIYRQTFDGKGEPLEYVESKYRSDKYKFHVELYAGEDA